ncbi:MAG: ABC transporter permease subunit [Gammaproteobacteria bacterium]|nr:ABC transporter permease subunit [Gammaproteobacteria bacterium]
MIEYWQYLPKILQGIGITLLLTLGSMILGMILTLIFTIGKELGPPLFRKLIDLMIWFICGTPLLVQIFLLYFGVAQFEWVRNSLLWSVLQYPFACAIIALTLNTACYSTVLFLGAIRSLPKNEVTAAYALGFTKWQAFKTIVLPRALQVVAPAYSNEVIMIVKNTSLASTITILDIMGVTQQLITESYQAIEWYMVAGLLYLVVNFFVMGLYQYFRKRNFYF